MPRWLTRSYHVLGVAPTYLLGLLVPSNMGIQANGVVRAWHGISFRRRCFLKDARN
jgi:hypothetical protein